MRIVTEAGAKVQARADLSREDGRCMGKRLQWIFRGYVIIAAAKETCGCSTGLDAPAPRASRNIGWEDTARFRTARLTSGPRGCDLLL